MAYAVWFVVILGIILLLKEGFDGFCNWLSRSATLKGIVWIAIIAGGICLIKYAAIHLFDVDMSWLRAAMWFVIVFVGLAIWGWINDGFD